MPPEEKLPTMTPSALPHAAPETPAQPATWSFDVIALPDVLLSLYCEYVTGLLTATSGDVTNRIWLGHGSIVTASTTAPSQKLGQHLIAEGLIDEARLEAALATSDGTPLGQHLVTTGVLTDAQLNLAVSKQILSIMRPMFGWDTVHAEFVVGESPLSVLPTCELSTADVILDGVAHFAEAELESVEESLREIDGCLAPNSDTRLRFQKTRLDSAKGLLLSMIDGNTSIDDLMLISPLPDDEMLIFVHAALSAGLIQRPVPSEPGAASADNASSGRGSAQAQTPGIDHGLIDVNLDTELTEGRGQRGHQTLQRPRSLRLPRRLTQGII